MLPQIRHPSKSQGVGAKKKSLSGSQNDAAPPLVESHSPPGFNKNDDEKKDLSGMVWYEVVWHGAANKVGGGFGKA